MGTVYKFEEKFGTQFLLFYILNQNINFFAVNQSKGGLHDQPDPIEFRYHLKGYILGRNERGHVQEEGDLAVENTLTSFNDYNSKELQINEE